MRADKKLSHKNEKKSSARGHKQGVVGYSKKSALLEEAITHMNTGKYGRSSAALKELLALDPQNTEARRLFATLHLRLGSLVTAREAFESLANEAIGRQDYWLAESLLREYLAAGPRCIPFLELLAHVYQEKGDDMAAVAELGKAIEILLEDPDPDNPKKPAQLYGKIRELAPASPIAFQYVSFFDVQTGEFRVPSSENQSSGGQSHKTDGPSVVDGLDPVAMDDQSEIMPWERVDEMATATQPSILESSTPETVQDVAQASPTVESEPILPTSIPFHASRSLDSTPTASTTVVESSRSAELEMADQTDAEQTSADSHADVAFNMTGLEGTSLLTEIPEAKLEIPERTPFSDKFEDSGSLPSPMPWEQMADPALEIPKPDLEREASIPPSESSVPIPVSDEQSPLGVAQAVEDPPLPVEVEPIQTVVESEPVRADSAPISSDASPTNSENFSISKPFSWNAIFDSAWKIAAGTTSSSASALEPVHRVEDVEGVAQPQTELETQKQEGAIASPQDALVTPATEVDHSVPVAEPSFALAEVPTLPQEPESVETWLPIDDRQGSSSTEEPPPVQPTADETATTTRSFWTSNLVAEPQQMSSAAAEISPVPAVKETVSVSEHLSAVVLPSPAEVEAPVASIQSSDVELVSPPSQSADAAATDQSGAGLDNRPLENPAPHWSTGEVAVQLHRPTAKKKQWEKASPVPGEEAPSPVDFRSAGSSSLELDSEGDSPVTDETAPIVAAPVQPVDTRPEWARASDAIVLNQAEAMAPTSAWNTTASGSYPASQPSSTPAASAVDILFGTTGRDSTSVLHEREAYSLPKPRRRIAARLARFRQNISSFIGSCFSTTRAFVLLCISLFIFSAVMVALGIGMLALAWIVMEESPTTKHQALTSSPQRSLTDPTKNGYLLLLGFDAPTGSDAIQVGYERKPTEQDQTAAMSCLDGRGGTHGTSKAGATSNVVNGWFKESDPMAQLKGQSDTIKSLVSQQAASLGRYQQWLSMPFDDWGYGKLLSPNCDAVLLAHRLYLLEGFSRDTATGLSRLEKDMDSWRTVLGQSKTLMTKMLAAAAVRDDAAVASGLLVRADADATTVARLSKIVRPLDQLELSVRWPMQSHFVWATGIVAAELKKDRKEERPFHVALAAAMPLPVQRRANAYADYYDSANKAVAEGRFASLPKRSTFMRTSGSSLVDYWANPIELIIGIDPLPDWDPYVGRMVETDAQLRLTSLQAWVRRGAQEGDVLARLAKAGQAYYDPFTGLPMLVNQQKRLLYSVGMDGKDQEGDRAHDVAVAIPSLPLSAADGKTASK